MPAMSAPSFSVLLARYLCWGWLFRDLSRGSLWERAAAWRHNRERAVWLPTYLRRYAAIFCAFVVSAHALSGSRPLGAAAFWALAVLVGAVFLATAGCWFVLTRKAGAHG